MSGKKLSPRTIEVLQNFAGINPNIVIHADTRIIKTMSEAKNIMAAAKIEDDINATIGIYDLNEFLSAIQLVPDPEFAFSPHLIDVKSANGSVGLKYVCANPEILTYPTKDINEPTYEVSMSIARENIAAIRKAASVLGFSQFSLVKESDSSDVYVKVLDRNNKSSNAFSLKVATIDNSSCSFTFDFLIANLKMIAGSYTLSLSSKCISKWVAGDLTYWIALETTSTYGE